LEKTKSKMSLETRRVVASNIVLAFEREGTMNLNIYEAQPKDNQARILFKVSKFILGLTARRGGAIFRRCFVFALICAPLIFPHTIARGQSQKS
jgi:hypothetical protein